jgi:probable rRNA maturation factor
MNVNIFNKQRDISLKNQKEKIILLARAVVALEKQNFDEVSITFATDAHTRKIHKEFFNDPTSTDCMSFPVDSLCDQEDVMFFDTIEDFVSTELQANILGELVVCPKTAIRYAKKHSKDPYEELTLYIVHGLLHLLGYDDMEPKVRRKMRQAEKKHMKALAQKGLVLVSP